MGKSRAYKYVHTDKALQTKAFLRGCLMGYAYSANRNKTTFPS